MSVKNEKFDGNVIIGRDLTLGGGVVTKGSSTFEKNLRVEGWLDAPNLRGACKGLFATEEKLNEMYPNPEDGMWAMVGETIPAYVYMAENGEWVDTGNLTDGIDINLNDTEIVINIDELRDRIDGLETGLESESTTRSESDSNITQNLIGVQQRITKELERIEVVVKLEVPDLASSKFGLNDGSEETRALWDAITSAIVSKKCIVLADALGRITPVTIYGYDSDMIALGYSLVDENYNITQYSKEICVELEIYDEHESPSALTALEFSDVYTQVQASSLKGSYSGSDDIVFFNTMTKTFCSVVVQSGVMPQYYGNSEKLMKYGSSSLYGKVPFRNVLYYTSSSIHLWDGKNFIKLLKLPTS